MAAPKKVVIKNEKAAFEFLQKAVQNELGDVPFELEFDGWPVLTMRVTGEGYDSTITSDMASALVDLQTALNRTYSRFVLGEANSRRLTDVQKQEIQFKAKVEEGSSLITVDLGKFGDILAQGIVAKMTPEMLAITVVGAIIIIGATISYKAFLKHRTEDKTIEEDAKRTIALSQEETRRLQVFADATKQIPQLVYVKNEFDSVRGEIVKGIGDGNSIAVNDLKISHETAKLVAVSKRRESKEEQLNGTYFILATNVRNSDHVRLEVRRAQDGREFSATFNDDSFDKAQITLLQEAEWGRTPVFLSINALVLEGEVTKATVISVTPQPAVSADRSAR